MPSRKPPEAAHSGRHPAKPILQGSSSDHSGITQCRKRKVARPRKRHPKILGPAPDVDLSVLMASPLLSLPSELRLLIYEYALTSPTGTLHYCTTKQCFDYSSIGNGLLTTCSTIAHETLYLPLRLNTLVFGYGSNWEDDAVSCLKFMRRRADVEGKLGRLLKIGGVQLEQKEEDCKKEEEQSTTSVGTSPVGTPSVGTTSVNTTAFDTNPVDTTSICGTA